MGDERKVFAANSRACPDCGDRISADAKRCACGWGKTSIRAEARHDPVCRWQYGQLSCRYPVGRFDQGEFRGLCIFHRASDRGAVAARIAEESQGHDRDAYVVAATKTIYGSGDNHYVAALRAGLKTPRRPDGGGLVKWLPAVMREPGQDEEEAR